MLWNFTTFCLSIDLLFIPRMFRWHFEFEDPFLIIKILSYYFFRCCLPTMACLLSAWNSHWMTFGVLTICVSWLLFMFFQVFVSLCCVSVESPAQYYNPLHFLWLCLSKVDPIFCVHFHDDCGFMATISNCFFFILLFVSFLIFVV